MTLASSPNRGNHQEGAFQNGSLEGSFPEAIAPSSDMREEDFLNDLLEGLSDKYRLKLLTMLRKYDLTIDEPLYMIMSELGYLRLLLQDWPEMAEQVTSIIEEAIDLFPEKVEHVFEQALATATNLTQETVQSRLLPSLEQWMKRVTQEIEQRVQSNQFEKERTLYQTRIAELHQEVERLKKKVVETKKEEKDLARSREIQYETLILKAEHENRQYYLILAGITMALCAVSTLLGYVAGGNHARAVASSSYQELFEAETGNTAAFAKQLLLWNAPNLQACQKVKRTTCNFHIVQPKEKQADQ